MKHFKRYVLPAIIVAVALAGWLVWRAAQPAPERLAYPEWLDSITVSAVLKPQQYSLSVTQTLKLTNRTGEKQDAAVLRTWANAFQSIDTSPCAADDLLYDQYYPNGFSMGGIVMAQAKANGEAVLYRYTDESKTVLAVPVPGGWQAGETVDLQLTYTVQVPKMAYRFGVWDDIWALGNAFAVPAVWQDGAFRTDEYLSVGDPFVSDCADYSVTVLVPQGYVCAGSGAASVSTQGSQTCYTFEAPAVRDFALVISDRFRQARTTANGVCITAYAQSKSQAREMLRYARKALDCYSDAYGAYAYDSYTLAQVTFPHGGMEYPALSMISTDLLNEGGRELEYAVAHETAHQWWYAAVGSDSWNQAWQDEALCEFSLLKYAQQTYGRGERMDLENARMESSLRVTVPHGVTPGAPLDYFSSMSEYKLLVYDRAAACLCAMDRTVTLDGFLRDYYARFAFQRATRKDFTEQLLISTGEDFAPLMRDYLDTFILN